MSNVQIHSATPGNEEAYSLDELLDLPLENIQQLNFRRLQNTTIPILTDYIETLDISSARAFLRKISGEQGADILAEMDPEQSADILIAMRQERAVSFLNNIDPDDAADIFSEIETENRERILSKLETSTANTISNLLDYDPDSAGGIMTPKVAKLDEHLTIDSAIGEIRRMKAEVETIYYLYITDNHDSLKGVISIRQLMMSKPKDIVGEIMTSSALVSCKDTDDKEWVARELAEHNLLAIPVVNDSGTLLGIVTHDDVIDVIEEEATEDIQKMMGAGADESIHDPVMQSIGRRSPWLIVNLFTSFIAATIILSFQDAIEQLSLLAVFLPIVASIAGNSGSQTLAVAIRSLATGDLAQRDSMAVCFRESLKGMFTGIAVGSIAAIAAYFISINSGASSHNALLISISLLLAMIFTMGLATLNGAFIPLFLKRMNLDPAQSSSIFLTATTDICGFFIFLKLGTLLLLG